MLDKFEIGQIWLVEKEYDASVQPPFLIRRLYHFVDQRNALDFDYIVILDNNTQKIIIKSHCSEEALKKYFVSAKDCRRIK